MNKKSSNTNIKIVYILGVIIGVLCILGKFLVPSFILKLTGIVLLLYAIINVIDILFLSNIN